MSTPLVEAAPASTLPVGSLPDDDLRERVVATVRRSDRNLDLAATALGLGPATVERLLDLPHWDAHLTRRLAAALGVAA